MLCELEREFVNIYDVAIPSYSGQVSTKMLCELEREFVNIYDVAIPSYSGQVSTRRREMRKKKLFDLVAIPSYSGQVSTWVGQDQYLIGLELFESQSLLIQGRFQQWFY